LSEDFFIISSLPFIKLKYLRAKLAFLNKSNFSFISFKCFLLFLYPCVHPTLSESPRGIEFLFSKNRLNVAISRAQALAIVVGSPTLATTPVNNLSQMELVNFYAEIINYGS
jgi:hypothetical protein